MFHECSTEKHKPTHNKLKDSNIYNNAIFFYELIHTLHSLAELQITIKITNYKPGTTWRICEVVPFYVPQMFHNGYFQSCRIKASQKG